jgi:hypothetical protein
MPPGVYCVSVSIARSGLRSEARYRSFRHGSGLGTLRLAAGRTFARLAQGGEQRT